jgi:hypothetical protein
MITVEELAKSMEQEIGACPINGSFIDGWEWVVWAKKVHARLYPVPIWRIGDEVWCEHKDISLSAPARAIVVGITAKRVAVKFYKRDRITYVKADRLERA